MPDSILIVEDESIIALDLKLQLQDLGYTVVGTAVSGEQALVMAEQRAPDLVLMDVRLQGGMDGIETAAAIRRTIEVPVIFLTSHSDNETVLRASRTAPYGYLTKPYEIRELRAGIEVALAKYRMERQLREADQWFAHTLRCVGDGVIVTDSEARVRFVNPAAERLTGWSQEDAIGCDVSDVVQFRVFERRPPEMSRIFRRVPSPSAAAVVRAVLRDGRPAPVTHALDLVARNGTGHLVDQAAGPVDDDRGQRMGAVLVLRDAEQRVAQETLLRASEERFRTAFDSAPLGMALVSLGGEFIQVNSALCTLLNLSADQLKLRTHAEVTLEADREHEVQRLHDLVRMPEGVVQFEKRYVRDGQAPVWTLVSVSLMREDDMAMCWLYQVHDLTQQKLAAEQVAELAAERMRRQALELASAAKSEFLSRVSHEMRTPLNAVIGFAQLLQMQRGADPGKTEAYAKHIRTAGEHMLAMVSDLLDINRAAQGTLRLVLEPLPLDVAVKESVHLLQTLADSAGVSLVVALSADAVVSTDATRLRQVLLNIGSNAIKYNRPGGQVRLEVSAPRNGRVLLTVQDTGVGMTPQQTERLFEPFDRLGQEGSRIPGVGLGLVIARGLMAEMGGTLTLASEAQVGTTVTIDLPAV
jgi:PAS domain S-box-containing protein